MGEPASRAQNLFDVSPHLLRLNELASGGGCFPPLNYLTKAFSLLQNQQRGVLHQMFGVALTGMAGKLGKLRFLFRREMNFHAPSE